MLEAEKYPPRLGRLISCGRKPMRSKACWLGFVRRANLPPRRGRNARFRSVLGGGPAWLKCGQSSRHTICFHNGESRHSWCRGRPTTWPAHERAGTRILSYPRSNGEPDHSKYPADTNSMFHPTSELSSLEGSSVNISPCQRPDRMAERGPTCAVVRDVRDPLSLGGY